MKTDSIFYRLFQTFPGTFFELISRQPSEASAYEFASVELKQTAFRIDGVFLPVPNLREHPIYFLEVQFQKDPEFYARFFCEIFLYLRLYAPTKAWRAVVLFPRRSLEPTEVEAYRVLLESSQVTRLYLNELGDAAEQSLGVGIIKLVVETKKRTPVRVRQLVDKARSELTDEAQQRVVLDLIETIVLYKLPLISRQELARMFSLSDLKRTRYYQEVRQEVREELQQEVREELQQKSGKNSGRNSSKKSGSKRL
jgi:predicted transposase/invertase (TIGR01784 family)